MERNLLEQLCDVPWSVMGRTYGSSHSTLIGLLVEWWVSKDADHAALEGGPSCGPSAKGQRGGQCDAILMHNYVSLGAVEVEGTRYDYTLDKLEHFFGSMMPDLQKLEFGIFLAYAVLPQGRGSERAVDALPIERWTERACEITRNHPKRELAIVALDKSLEICKSGPRARNDYYQCKTSRIHGVLVRDGRLIDRQTLWQA